MHARLALNWLQNPQLLFSFPAFFSLSHPLFLRLSSPGPRATGFVGRKQAVLQIKHRQYRNSSETQALPSASSGGITPSLAEWPFLTLPDISEAPGKAVHNLGMFTVSIPLTGELFPPASQRGKLPHSTCLAYHNFLLRLYIQMPEIKPCK